MDTNDLQAGPDNARVSIEVTRDYLTFSSAHFAQRSNGTSEPIHGHNYTVTVRVQGPIDQLGYVADFVTLKSVLVPITRELNHRLLLSGQSDRVTIARDGDEVVVRADGRRYVFPASDVVVLPIRNTTCEELAAHIGMAVLAKLSGGRLEIKVEESPGQGACWRSADGER